MIRKITPTIVPPSIPRRGANWLARLAAYILNKRGWRASGDMINAEKSVLAVAPHTSNWDFFLGLLIVFSLKLDISFLGKHTIFAPPLGWIMRKLGGIPVQRKNPRGLVGQVAGKIKQSRSVLLAIAPEGTRSPVFPWKTGFLRIAEAVSMPVQLIGFDYRHKHIIFGPVISPGDKPEEQMRTIYSFYATVSGKYPDKCITLEPDE